MRTPTVLALLAVAVTAGPSAPALAQLQAPGRWLTQKFAPVPAPEEEYWNAVANGKVYLMGGNQNGANDRVLEYDMAADRWTTKKPAPFSANHMALVEYRGKVYVFGGATVESQPNALKSWEYDPIADAWRELAPMPSKRTAAVAVANNGKFYVIGGSDEVGVSVATNEVYDLATNTWSSARPMLTARNHPAGGVVNGKVYVIGGRLTAANVANMVSSATDIVEEYDPATDKWKSMTKMPYLTSGQGWITYQNKIYVAGGELRDAHLDATFRDVVAYDPAANDWYRLPSMPTARHGVVVGALGNRLFFIAGHTAFNGNGGAALHSALVEVFEFTAAGR